MSSATDTSSSCSLVDDLKTSKKLKRKSGKKHKKHKKDKRQKKIKRSLNSNTNSDLIKNSTFINIPPSTIEYNDVPEEETFGPALPPHLLQKQEFNDKSQSDAVATPKIMGPNLPQRSELIALANENRITNTDDEDNNGFSFGPMPEVLGENAQMSAPHIELEQRALELKLAAMQGASITTVEQKVREEWMLELPEVGLKGGMAALLNMKRTFHHGKERPDFSDRSEWTKTPNNDSSVISNKPTTSKMSAEKLKNNAQAHYERQRDEEQERLAKKHKKKNKRDESLLDIHQKKLRKEQRKKEKELAALGAMPERRPFSRDVDLKLNIIDKNQTKQIVDKAKILNTKFGSGQTKYL